jgi:hypothetical protein
VTDEDLKARFEKLETMLAVLIERQQVREYYTSEEFATLVGKAPWTLREYCRLGRLHATKRLCGKGGKASWVLSHEEYLRYQKEGLLPSPTNVNQPGGGGGR